VKDGADGGGLVARRGHEAEERKEGVCSRGRRRRRKIGRGGKGGAAAMGHPFKEVRQGGGAGGGGDGPWEVHHGGEEWGRAWGPARWSGDAVWPAAVLTSGVRAGCAQPAPKQGRQGTTRWGPSTVTRGRI
jgi:hypothetical protein